MRALEECAPLVRGSTAYISQSPCWTCMKLLAFAGVKRIVYRKEYRTGVARQLKLAAEYRISFEQLEER
jgi:dCMP deaminase